MTTIFGDALRAGSLGLVATGLAVVLLHAQGVTAAAVRTAAEVLLLAAPLGLATPPGAAGSRAAAVWALAAPILHSASEASGGSSLMTGLLTTVSVGMILTWNAAQGKTSKQGLEVRRFI